MHLNKTDGLTIGFVLVGATAILINGYLKKDSLLENTAINETPTPSVEFLDPIDDLSQSPVITEDKMGFVEESKAVLLPFSEAFVQARINRGPGALFEWNGKSYTTSYAEEIVKPGEKLDSTRINLVLNQPPEK
ncbi:MAG: hypothetical protein QF842_05360 [Candidatus Marinimicrobia bacterium]|nr:hypothetical protein [Candidatus Neomarinimicrobiota bacterium]MDP6611216.1 hypothetical protein [Candidatus Neomarinimicrobiota bacterium]